MTAQPDLFLQAYTVIFLSFCQGRKIVGFFPYWLNWGENFSGDQSPSEIYELDRFLWDPVIGVQRCHVLCFDNFLCNALGYYENRQEFPSMCLVGSRKWGGDPNPFKTQWRQDHRALHVLLGFRCGHSAEILSALWCSRTAITHESHNWVENVDSWAFYYMGKSQNIEYRKDPKNYQYQPTFWCWSYNNFNYQSLYPYHAFTCI